MRGYPAREYELSVGPAFGFYSVPEGRFGHDACDGSQKDEYDSTKGDGRRNWTAV
jgi:hypothetical protein